MLRTGCRGKSAVDVARELLRDFGSLRSVLHCSIDDFCKYPGLGKTKWTQLQTIVELSTRYLHEKLDERDLLRNTKEVHHYLRTKLEHLEYEIFACLFLDSRNHLIAYEELSHGTHNQSAVYPREIMKRALTHNAAALIFAHNHPSGEAKPSVNDRILTQELQKLFFAIDIKIHDHFIIGNNKIYSFAEHGLLS